MLFQDRKVLLVEIAGALDVSEGYVPARNLVIASICAQHGNRVLIGGLRDDGAADQSLASAEMNSRVLSTQCGYDVSVEMPLVHLAKVEAVSMYLQKFPKNNLRIASTFSCYEPKENKPCKKCPACFRWSVALLANNVPCFTPDDSIIVQYLYKLHEYDESRRWSILKALEIAKGANKKEVWCVDIDGVITEDTAGWDYAKRKPNSNAIERVKNAVLNNQAWVVLYTARPEMDREPTMQWLLKNHVRFHALLMNKPPATLRIDDISIKEL